jgi:hypothetical protein
MLSSSVEQAQQANLPLFSARMGMITKVILVLVVVAAVGLLGGGAFLAFWDIPAPTAKVEKVLPDARFPK